MSRDNDFMENLKANGSFAGGEKFLPYDDQEIRMSSGEDRNVHRYASGVRFVQSNAEISFAAE